MRLESSSRFSLLFEHDLIGKPLRTFPDHALYLKFDETAELEDEIGYGLAEPRRVPERGRERREGDHGVPVPIAIDRDRGTGRRKVFQLAQLAEYEIGNRFRQQQPLAVRCRGDLC